MHPIFRHIISRRNLLILAAALLAGFAFWYFRDLQDIYDSLLNYFTAVAEINRFLAGVFFFLLATFSAVLTFFSSTPVIPIAVEIFGRGLTLVLIMGGWLLGGIIAYWIFYYLRHFFSKFKIFKQAEHYEQKLIGRTEFPLILLFRLAIPAEIGSYALGLLRFPFWKYVLITFLGELPFAVIALYSNTAFVERKPLVFVGVLAIGMVIIGVAVYYFYKRLRKV